VNVRILAIGDIVGKPGRSILMERLPALIEEREIDFVVANGENAAQGSGITRKLFKEVISAGVDCVTCGDHVWKRMEIKPVLESESRLLRPLNYPGKAAGRGTTVLTSRRGMRFGVITVIGQVFMSSADSPFLAVEKALEIIGPETKLRIVEVHAEATSEKLALAWKLDGQVSFVFGTHTHIPTADARILPGGTAYITDLGMTGPYDSVIGRDKESVLYKFETSMHATFSVATGDVRLCGALVTVDANTGKATGIERIEITQ
jgi:metallophosphoesterase (TIGR00282 family)